MDGPVLPSPGALSAHRPPPDAGVRVTGGLFGRWLDVNRAGSIPLALHHLETSGALGNLRIAAGLESGSFRGPVYADSDVHKMLESAAWQLQHTEHDAGLSTFLDEGARLLARAQEDDGYLDSHYQVAEPERRYARLVDSHELYCAGHLLQAAVAVHRTTGGTELLTVARRLADHLCAVFLDDAGPGLDGHPEAETALVELYRVTGDERCLTLATRLVERRGHGLVGRHKHGTRHRLDHLPVRSAPSVTGHVVRALYLEAGAVDVAVETGDKELLAASAARWTDMAATRTSLTGGLGSRQVGEVFGERYELPPDLAYNETCASAASIQWSWRLLLATGEGRYADLLERTLYNAFAAARSADGRTYYKGNPLQRRPDHAEAVGDPRCRDEWFYSACCPPSVTRLVASLPHYATTTADDTLFLHLYAPMRIACTLPTGQVALRVETEYPWDGTVRITVEDAPDGDWTLALRVPPWSARTRLDGEPVAPDAQGRLLLRHAWRAGDEVVLDLDMTPRLTAAHPRIDALRGSVAVERGPLVYCFEQTDQPAGTDVDELALPADAELRVTHVPDLPGVGRTVRIEADAETVRAPHRDGLPYLSPDTPLERRPATATAVPYFQWDNRGDGAMRVWVPVTY
ncbi:glycoside hydrolase family 127 protein [Streptomyces longispororuber]|uniref:glycoside hydrolase family 127 protein n=1 Tax=Streptomyces longispororuber TaxID=68230 RepID=UPI002109C5A6|nr:beta-L-arabinofuranosidase domain-containing protein [Streptomyces longispororuber]MCQ4209531.1 glycoside hydrolase family 127 protein [Streptomyces longispororuber]